MASFNMADHVKSAFKPHPMLKTPGKRPHSPEPPIIEPLSPVLAPSSTPFQRFIASSGTPFTTAGQAKKASRARKVSSTKNNIHESPQHGRKASGTIDDLAQAAIAIASAPPPQPAIYSHAHGNGLPTYHTAQSMQWGQPPPAYEAMPRPSKRARSEAEAYVPAMPVQPPMQYGRPTTSHVPAQKRLSESDGSSLADAALLLSFAASVPSRTLRGIEPVQATLPVSTQTPASTAPSIPNASPTASAPAMEPQVADYLPSPKPTKDEVSWPVADTNMAEEHTAVPEEQSAVHQGAPQEVQSHIQTPPEDTPVEDTHNAEEAAEEKVEDNEDETDAADQAEDKPKRRGWPKGKPRGPRKSGAASSKPRSSTARRGRKSQAPYATEEAVLPRRKSTGDLTSLTDTEEQPHERRSSLPTIAIHAFKIKANSARRGPRFTKDTVCESCKTARESSHGEQDQWISCNGCRKWFHSDCAGFEHESKLKDVDKYFCVTCEPKHGATTFVRKSTRAHTDVDYAAANEGIYKTSAESVEHHYIQPIKDGKFTFDSETFPRMRPELVTREYFERSACFTEPILIPAHFNPKPTSRRTGDDRARMNEQLVDDHPAAELADDFEYETVPDDGQDRLDMVIPQDLTVREVANLVGPDYPLEVIDVKVQNIEGAKWNLGKWADYYEAGGEKAIRNVISLEVAHTKLGKLLRRPKLVRQIDLQDNVWPENEWKKSVGFYCLMSVADSYTDFHIDFGGSSVYYHILRGSKTFFFIPPKPKHLKAYEDWNNSHEQNNIFLPDVTKECYRVDLFEGDTMLIPSGWIHAVWTPSNSLVIGGNFLTHMHYSTQFRVCDVEKANNTNAKFKYPMFQKVMWYSVLRYLREDPLPESVRDDFYQGQQYNRDHPSWMDFDCAYSKGSGEYHARYYSQMELDGLTELASYIFRTVMISQDRIEGITAEVKKKVVASIPKGYGDFLELAKTFAMWVAWKRGNEDPPAWAHPDACLPEKEGAEPKKLSAKALRAMQRQEKFEAVRAAPERQSIRQKEKEEKEALAEPTPPPAGLDSPNPQTAAGSPVSRKGACEACRKRRIRCKHKVEQPLRSFDAVVISKIDPALLSNGPPSTPMHVAPTAPMQTETVAAPVTSDTVNVAPAPVSHVMTPQASVQISPAALRDSNAKLGRSKACPECRKSKVGTTVSETILMTNEKQRRCVHDENGNVDPFKEKQTPVPRGSTGKKRKGEDGGESQGKKVKSESRMPASMEGLQTTFDSSMATMPDMNMGAPAPDWTAPGQLDFAVDPQLMDMGDMGDHMLDGIEVSAFQGLPDQMGHDATAIAGEHLDAAGIDALGDMLQVGISELETRQADDHRTLPGTLPSYQGLNLVDDSIQVVSAVPSAKDTIAVKQEAQAARLDPLLASGDPPGAVPESQQPIFALSTGAMSSIAPPQLSTDRGIDQPIESKSGLMHHTSTTSTDSTSPSYAHSTAATTDQTPSANDPPSLSSASSPLSDPGIWQELPTPSYEQTNRHSSRHLKPVERFASQTFEVPPMTEAGGKRASASATPGPRRGSVASVASASSGMRKTPRASVESEELGEDERYARELAGQSFGLRVRRSVGS